MNEEVLKEIENLEGLKKSVIDLGAEMLNGDIYPLDILCSTVLDRSLHLIFGFTTLIKGNNFIASAHLVRCHLDNILRFSAAWIVEDPHDFANKIIGGQKIEDLRDKNGHLLKDWHLRNKLNEQYPWVENVYKESSGFIHLSKKHIFSSSKFLAEEDRTIQLRISEIDNFVQDESRIEAILCMKEITLALIKFVEGWIWTKKNPTKKSE